MKANEIVDRIDKEAFEDLQAEARGEAPPVGSMQETYPAEYAQAKETWKLFGTMMVEAAMSYKRAKRLAEMAIDDDEGLSSIHDSIGSQPLNALEVRMIASFSRNLRQKKHARLGRGDALQGLIIEIVEENPGITGPELEDTLRSYAGNGVIEEIDDDDELIYFINKKGVGGNSARLSGLKDRLSRAKKKLKSL